MAKKNMKLVEMGRTGLTRFGGYISEEWFSELQGKKGSEIYNNKRRRECRISFLKSLF